jgi:hypothetical protein
MYEPTNDNTVKPLYNDHPRNLEKVVVIQMFKVSNNYAAFKKSLKTQGGAGTNVFFTQQCQTEI